MADEKYGPLPRGACNPVPKAEQRAPMLSEEEIMEYGSAKEGQPETVYYRLGMLQARKFYEAKITSGELMVVKTCTMRKIGDMDALKCNSCHHEWLPSWQTAKFCPGCGSRIIT